jgi:hypothetical protein
MMVDPEPISHDACHSAPSAEFIHAISEFFDTDPSDLLLELGYYTRTEAESALPSVAGASE